MKTMNGLKVAAFAALCAMAATAAHATPVENGIGWNGIGWNGIGWNGIGWNGIGWNGQTAPTARSDSQRMELSLQLISLASQPLQ